MKNIVVVIVSIIIFLTLNSCKEKAKISGNNVSTENIEYQPFIQKKDVEKIKELSKKKKDSIRLTRDRRMKQIYLEHGQLEEIRMSDLVAKNIANEIMRTDKSVLKVEVHRCKNMNSKNHKYIDGTCSTHKRYEYRGYPGNNYQNNHHEEYPYHRYIEQNKTVKINLSFDIKKKEPRRSLRKKTK
ncbi:MAG: hypothetical protein LR005_01190 [Candidatus Pacebacteria bacterium]|nr:hypothetical protein [Candidatus Paceibacterota bacterium]